MNCSGVYLFILFYYKIAESILSAFICKGDEYNMQPIKQVALTCITHDPTGSLLSTIKELKEKLIHLNYHKNI